MGRGQTDKHTNTQTDFATTMTELAQWADSAKSILLVLFFFFMIPSKASPCKLHPFAKSIPLHNLTLYCQDFYTNNLLADPGEATMVH